MTLPFFVLHGEADTVTDPEVSRALYEQASSADKTMKMYAGMWHGLTAGEPDDNIKIVFTDILAWLDKRSEDESARFSKLSQPKREQNECETRSNAKNSHGWKGRCLFHSAM